MTHPFAQVDVFSSESFGGNPVAVVLDADGLADDTMQLIARWTNLSETTFVLTPSDAGADYQVRIFTPAGELPFAGHPTLGTCHAWLEAGGTARPDGTVVQQCPAGLVTVRSGGSDGRLAFAAPPLVRSGPVDDATVAEAVAAVQLDPACVLAAEWVDNGPGWLALLVDSPATVLAARAGATDLKIGLVAAYPEGSPEAIEVRAFFPADGRLFEDPVTGSLNASLGQWLTSSGRVTAPYVAAQGRALGRAGRVHVELDENGAVWVGGATVTRVSGTIEA
jgi:PhzF family phenazine biosynthesis protein